MKTKKDLMDILTQANPKGFVMVVDNNGEGVLINNPATLNIGSFGYKNSEGIDITEGKTEQDFIALPGYDQAGIETPSGRNDNIELSDIGGAFRRGRSEVFKNSVFIKLLQSKSDDAVLVSFDGFLIDEVKLNGGDIAYIVDDWGNKHYMRKIRPNDFVVLVKGEQLDHFFRTEYRENKLNEELSRNKRLMK